MDTPSASPAGLTRAGYGAIWGVLVFLLLLSLVGVRIGDPAFRNLLVFGVAAVKAFLVLRYYMHLRWEPLFVGAILLSALLCLAVLFVALLPDVVWRDGWVRP